MLLLSERTEQIALVRRASIVPAVSVSRRAACPPAARPTLELGQRRLLDAGDPQLAVEPALISRWLDPSRRRTSETSRWRSSRSICPPLEGRDLPRPAPARARRPVAGSAQAAALGHEGHGRHPPRPAARGDGGPPEQRHLRGDVGAQGHELRRLASRSVSRPLGALQGPIVEQAVARRGRSDAAAPPARSAPHDLAASDPPARRPSSAPPVGPARCGRSDRPSAGRSAASWRRSHTRRPATGDVDPLGDHVHRHDPRVRPSR